MPVKKSQPETKSPIDRFWMQIRFDELKAQNLLILAGIEDLKKQNLLILSKLGGGVISLELEQQILRAKQLSKTIDDKVPD